MAELLKLICKAFWSATYMGIPDTLLQQDQFVGWMTCIHALMDMPVPKVRSASYYRNAFAVHPEDESGCKQCAGLSS